MSRLDQQISHVRTRLLVDRFTFGLAWALAGLLCGAMLCLLVGKLFQIWIPKPELVWLGGAIVSVLAAGVYALLSPPSARVAAVAIDERLGLKEKFSTALFARRLRDPFAVAVVRDAERTADSVSLRKRFPLHFPTVPAVYAAIAGMALLIVLILPSFDLGGVKASQVKKQQLARQERAKAERALRQAIVQIDSAPKAVADTEEIKLARQDLSEMLKKPVENPVLAQQKAEKALSDMESMKQKIKDQQRYAEAQNQIKAFSNMAPPQEDQTPVAKAQDAMTKGNFSEAVESIGDAVKNFDKMSDKDKQKTADAMQRLAQQMQQMANNPQAQQQMQQQLQQMGANQQQAQQIQQMMQQAANGNQQAQQQLQQMANQLAQQMNQQKGGSPQQQQQVAQQIQKAMQQMQQQSNSQAQAQQMSQAAQQLAQAMQQSAAASQQARQGGQQAKAGGQQQGQQGSQQASSQGQSGQKQGGQQGGAQSAQQQMAQAGQSMQQQLQQLQAMAKDQQAVNAGQQGGGQQQGGQQGQNGNNGQQPNGAQQGGGQWAKGNPNGQQGQGFGGPGQAQGGRPAPEVAPFGVKQELSQSQVDDKGKVLASSFVKAGSVKGDSKVGLASAVLNEQQDATDEVDEDRIPKSAAKAVKDYFQTIKEDSK